MREKIIVGNWKMYKTVPEALTYLDELIPLVKGCERKVLLGVPFTAIHACKQRVEGSGIRIGAQNMHDATDGAYTGEVAGRMLVDAGASFVILGHSERRHVFGESSFFVNHKVKRALADQLEPIVCVGETLKEREEGRAEEVLAAQLCDSLKGLPLADIEKLVLAYEPVWAIGTGHTATPEIAEKVHVFLRALVKEKWGDEVGQRIPILYGGSVKPDNAQKLLAAEDVDGLLVGGASLSAESFSQIIGKACQSS